MSVIKKSSHCLKESHLMWDKKKEKWSVMVDRFEFIALEEKEKAENFKRSLDEFLEKCLLPTRPTRKRYKEWEREYMWSAIQEENTSKDFCISIETKGSLFWIDNKYKAKDATHKEFQEEFTGFMSKDVITLMNQVGQQNQDDFVIVNSSGFFGSTTIDYARYLADVTITNSNRFRYIFYRLIKRYFAQEYHLQYKLWRAVIYQSQHSHFAGTIVPSYFEEGDYMPVIFS